MTRSGAAASSCLLTSRPVSDADLGLVRILRRRNQPELPAPQPPRKPPIKAGVYDRGRLPVQIEGRPVVAYYEIHENEHRIVFSHFGVD